MTWQINLLLVLCFVALKKNVEIMYLFMYLQNRGSYTQLYIPKLVCVTSSQPPQGQCCLFLVKLG